ncbi:hypothetical protein F4556_006927 [Kitasatospora gansuensis]|uniref:Uncharacterized protein n=1 Tax=Kitasatospora gansuensis TaxID=258050 RepID=A0A7W7SJA6_9ACTN|nr:hypothetical protein [Kitasatospora gansuensis]
MAYSSHQRRFFQAPPVTSGRQRVHRSDGHSARCHDELLGFVFRIDPVMAGGASVQGLALGHVWLSREWSAVWTLSGTGG